MRGRGVSEKPEPQGTSCFLGFQRRRASGEENGWLCQNGREIWSELVREKLFFGARNFARNVARNFGAYDLEYPKISHIAPAYLVPKIPRPFLNLFLGFSLLLTLVCLATDCSPFSWVETKPHRELGPGVQQSYNIASNETNRM